MPHGESLLTSRRESDKVHGDKRKDKKKRAVYKSLLKTWKI